MSSFLPLHVFPRLFTPHVIKFYFALRIFSFRRLEGAIEGDKATAAADAQRTERWTAAALEKAAAHGLVAIIGLNDGRCAIDVVLIQGCLRLPEVFLPIVESTPSVTAAIDKVRSLLHECALANALDLGVEDQDLEEMAGSTTSVTQTIFKVAAACFGLSMQVLHDDEAAATVRQTIAEGDDPKVKARDLERLREQRYSGKRSANGVVADDAVALMHRGHFTALVKEVESSFAAMIQKSRSLEYEAARDKTSANHRAKVAEATESRLTFVNTLRARVLSQKAPSSSVAMPAVSNSASSSSAGAELDVRPPAPSVESQSSHVSSHPFLLLSCLCYCA